MGCSFGVLARPVVVGRDGCVLYVLAVVARD
jgi:hypothetical protein